MATTKKHKKRVGKISGTEMALIGVGGLALVYFMSRPAAAPPQTIIRTIPLNNSNPTNTAITTAGGVVNNLFDDIFG